MGLAGLTEEEEEEEQDQEQEEEPQQEEQEVGQRASEEQGQDAGTKTEGKLGIAVTNPELQVTRKRCTAIVAIICLTQSDLLDRSISNR